MPKFLFKLALVFFSCFSLANAEATKLPGSIALHIAKTHYLHPVHLLHPYLDIWHMKGPLAEKAAIKALKERFADITECTKDSKADVVLLLEPHMFYNPQLGVFHVEFIARAYTTSSTQPIMRIKKQTGQLGNLDVTPAFYMEKGYTKAIKKVIKQLVVDKAFLATLDKNSKIDAGAMCSELDNLPLAKLYY